MASESGQCPFLVPVMADGLWLYPVPAYCRRPDAAVKVPGRRTLSAVCTSREYVQCPGFLRSHLTGRLNHP